MTERARARWLPRSAQTTLDNALTGHRGLDIQVDGAAKEAARGTRCSYFAEGAPGRYSTRLFLRNKLGNALSERGLAPPVFESAAEAQAYTAGGG